MSIPSSSSNASSPSYNPHSGDDVTAARFNPLFIKTSSASHINHNLIHNHNHSHKSISDISNLKHNHYHSHKRIITDSSHNHNSNIQNSISSINNYHSINNNNNHSHNSSISTSMAGNSSPNSMQLSEAAPSRKVHVVYYLSRAGQLEHPHLLEVSIPPNQGLYLRDVKKRLAAIRGKRLPLTFAWSYKRSYKNGYVWQDLCDDDLIFPAHGCEYVLKGSEILSDQSNNEECGHTPLHNSDAGSTIQNGSKEDLQGLTSITPKGVYQNHEETGGAVPGSASLHVSMVESGTDAATQTEEELRRSDAVPHEHEENSNSLYISHYKLNAKQSLSSSPHKASCTTTRPQHATELNTADIASPPSSSSATNSPSPYKELASTSSSSASGFNMATEHNDNVATSNENVKTSDYNLGSKTPGRSWMKRAIHKVEEQEEIISLHAADEEGGMNDGGLSNPTHESASSKNKYRSMGSNSIGAVIMEDGEQSPAGSIKPGRSKHSGALSLLQFMSCGGLDIKEQILPMSLYRLRSKGTPAAANQLHMSNYMLSPEHSGAEALGYGGSETGKLWTKIGKPKSLYNLNSSKPLYKAIDEYNGVSDMDNQWVHHKHHYPQHEGASTAQATSPSPMANGSSSKTLGGSIPDVISIGRSSISDRSTNASHELEYQVADVHAKLRKSGEVMSFRNNGMKGSPRFNVGPEVSLDFRNNEGTRSTVSTVVARAVSGEILMSKGSPLFVPSKRHLSYSGTPLSYASNGKPPLAQLSTSVLHIHEAGNNQTSMKLDGQNKACSSSCNPSRAFSEGEVSSLLANRIMTSNQKSMTINGYDQSMAQLWEELLAAPMAATKSEEHQHKDADYQRVRQATTGSSSWEVERTLQNAVELSLQPPMEHLPLLLDCPQCGRKVKAELLKAHVKNCSSPKPNTRNTSLFNTNFNMTTTNNNNNNLGKSPKSDSNLLCQRFLRASPPPTKL